MFDENFEIESRIIETGIHMIDSAEFIISLMCDENMCENDENILPF